MMTTAKADAVGTAPGGANPAVVLSRIGRAKAFGCGLMVLEGWPV